MANFDRAIALMTQLWTRNPRDSSLGTELVEALSCRAHLRGLTGSEQGRADDVRQAEKIVEKVRDVCSPDEKDAILRALAGVYYRGNDMDKCLKAIPIFRGLESRKGTEVTSVAPHFGGRGSSESRPKWGLRGALQNGGDFLNMWGHPAKAEPLLRESVDIVRTEIRENPQADQPLLYLEIPLGNLGESFFLQGQIRSAKKALEEVIALREELRRREIPFGGGNLMFYVQYAYFLACAEGESGNLTKGISHCDLALQVAQEVRDSERVLGEDSPVIVNLEVWIREARSRFEFAAGKISRDELINRQRQIVAERKSLRERGVEALAFPSQYVNEWSSSASALAGYLLDAGQAEASLAIINEVLPDQQRLVENDKPDNRDVPEYDLRAYILRQTWAELLSRQADSLSRLGKPTDAAKSIRQAIDIIEPFTKPEPCYLYDLAHYLTLASTLPGDAGLSKPADQAVEAIRNFIASGFDNPYKLRHDPRLEPLRKREDFQTMVRELEAKLAAESKK
jgi:tetratricopeptide (TPR) repeat protein